MAYHSHAGDSCRPEGLDMRDIEWVVIRDVVLHADGAGASPLAPMGARGSRPDGVALVVSDGRTGERWDERLADIRQRVRDGSYDTRAVMDQVARRILASGDL